MFVKSLLVRQFRCFESFQITFDAPITIIEGPNGSGKTSLVEALYYACYLKSFRTHLPREMAQWDKEGFSLVLTGASDASSMEVDKDWDLKVVISNTKRLIKANGAAISSYKELFNFYRMVALSAQDLLIVSGSPEERRQFIDHAVLLTDPLYAQSLKSFRKTLKQRNALLAQGALDRVVYEIWTERLQGVTSEIRTQRERYLADLQVEVNRLVKEHLESEIPTIELQYKIGDDQNSTLERETYVRRSLMGAHLDEINILFNGQSARRFASRGQLKLIVYFLKLTQLSLLKKPTIVVVDDFITDFDEQRSERLLELLCGRQNHSLAQRQVIFTVPSGCDLGERMKKKNYAISIKTLPY
ncbi:TPA: hypothetical protein DDZ86_03750 [Candidatus Dependentiae bacterium]|nr:MAG: replication and repair protein RecF protein [candidate division TM6 bacterium GW2011_GWF2_43_87]HBL98730.1 hypothetical protein [Candidatus Dependentiae bacterium]